MDGYKISLLIVLLFGICIAVLQQFGISELKSENKNLQERIALIDMDASLIGKVFLSKNEKVEIIKKLKENDPDLEIIEYDLGSVKLRGLEMAFDPNGKLKSITSRLY